MASLGQESPRAVECRESCNCGIHTAARKAKARKARVSANGPDPLWEGALERGAFCSACGQLSEDERPLFGDDEQFHCPRFDCDAVVKILDAGHPTLPGGTPYSGVEHAVDTVRYWQRHLLLKVVPDRGRVFTGYPHVQSACPPMDPDDLEDLRASKEALRFRVICRLCGKRGATSWRRVEVRSVNWALGRAEVQVCTKCHSLALQEVDVKDLHAGYVR